MSDQIPPSPESDPEGAAPSPIEPDAPAPDAFTPEPAPVDAAPEAAGQWPTEGYVSPPPTYPAPDTPAPPPPAYAAPEAPAYPPPPAYPTPAYPATGYPSAAAAPQTSSNAIIALILAIVSWAVCPIIPAIVALVLAGNAAKEIAASGGRIQGAGLVTASRIVSWVNIGLWAAIIVVGAFFLVIAIIAGAANNA